MGKRFAILHGVSMRVEEVTDRRHDFIPNQRVEMPKLDIQRLVAEFTIKLWHSQAIVTSGIPISIKSTSNGVQEVSTIKKVNSTTYTDTFVFQNPLVDQVELIHLALPSTIIERDRTVPVCSPTIGTNTNVNKTVGFNSSV